MKRIGIFQSKNYGAVHVLTSTYGLGGALAVALENEDGEPLTKLSVNMYRTECSRDSLDLPNGCFYAKDYGENEELATEALASGLFKLRDDIPRAESGFISVPVWQINDWSAK